jgi:hypothetical protein
MRVPWRLFGRRFTYVEKAPKRESERDVSAASSAAESMMWWIPSGEMKNRVLFASGTNANLARVV